MKHKMITVATFALQVAVSTHQTIVVSKHPPLTPAEAVKVLLGGTTPEPGKPVVYLTGLPGWKPEPYIPGMNYRPTYRSTTGDGPYGPLLPFEVQYPSIVYRARVGNGIRIGSIGLGIRGRQ